MTRPYQADKKMFEPLAFVTTISEAAELWYRHRSTIRYAIDAGNIAAVQSGRTWLISVPSLVAIWGDPPALSGKNSTFDNLGGAKTPLRLAREGGQYATGQGNEQRPALPAHTSLSGVPEYLSIVSK